jgi:hypothetical protein
MEIEGCPRDDSGRLGSKEGSHLPKAPFPDMVKALDDGGYGVIEV